MNRIRNSYYGISKMNAPIAFVGSGEYSLAGNPIATNAPAAITEVPPEAAPFSAGFCRGSMNFLYFPMCQFSFGSLSVKGSAGTILGVQWATSDAGPWTYLVDGVLDTLPLDGTVGQPQSKNFFLPNTLRYAGWVVLRLVTQGGNGVADPQWNACTLYVYGFGVWGNTSVVSGPAPMVNFIAPPSTQNRVCAPQTFFNNLNVSATWTNQPAALTEYNSSTANRPAISLFRWNGLCYFSRANVITAGAGATTTYSIQLSTNGGVSWNYIDLVSGPLMNLQATGTKHPGNGTAPLASVSDTWPKGGGTISRCVGINGNGVADPAIGNVAYILQIFSFDPGT